MSEEGAEPGSEGRGSGARRRGRWLRSLKFVIAVALLFFVANRLPWSDSLRWLEGEQLLEVEGEIEGGWRSQQITFHLDPETTLAESWPEEARTAAREGGALHVARPESPDEATPGGHYEWRPGMPRVFLDLRAVGLLAAFGAFMMGVFFGVTRWWRLLALAECPCSWWNALRLSFLGLFFNLVMPGLTGGDLPKAILVVRENPERRAAALATVVIDRLVGLWTLVTLATVVIWLGGELFVPLRWPAAGALVAATAGMALLLASGPRRLLRLDRLIERLPYAARWKRLEEAALVFKGKPLELGFSLFCSLGNHLFVIAGIWAIGRAFGDLHDFGTYVAITPVANVITALPLSPGGWGVGEAAFGTLFAMIGAEAALGVAVSVTYRLCNAAFSLLGGIFLLAPGGASVRDEVREVESVLPD